MIRDKSILFLALFFISIAISSQTIDTAALGNINDSLKNNSVDTASLAANNDSTISSRKILTIIPDEKVKDKLSDIFSVSKLIWAFLFIILSHYFLKIVSKILDKISERSTHYRIGLKGVIPVVRIIGWTISISIVVIVIFAPPVESLVVVTGSLGLAVGFASQDILKNIFGGIMILFDRPFQVGDKVQIGEFYGEVTNIGLRSTRIVTPDDSMVSIPNGDIMSKSVSNSNSGEATCQVVSEIFLPINVDTSKAREIAIASAKVSPYIFLNKPVVVIFKNEIHYGRSVLKMRLKAYVLDIRYEFVFMSEMTERTIRELIDRSIIPEDFKIS